MAGGADSLHKKALRKQVERLSVSVKLQTPGLADGIYKVKKKGALAASLYWADQDGALKDWSSIACIPISPYGQGEFRFTGGRAVPPEATHVLARVIMPDFGQCEEYMTPVPADFCTRAISGGVKMCAMSDLHLSDRDGRIRRALHWAEGADALLLAGDLVNDGLPGQFKRMYRCLEEELPGTPVFAVGGNHDQPFLPLPHGGGELSSFPLFREALRKRSEAMGICWEVDDSGAYSVKFKGLEVIGLEAVTHGRRFTFPEDRQLHFLERRLEERRLVERRLEESGGDWRIVICHAPLLAHNPQRKPGERSTPYMGGDGRLQKILDGHRNIIFLSGHTHFSPNVLEGCVEYDKEGKRIYINDGSVCPTQFRQEEPMVPAEWVSGMFVEIRVDGQEVELLSRGAGSGMKYPRGYYRMG